MSAIYVLLLFALTAALSLGAQQECRKRDYGKGGDVCVCNSDYCDTLPSVEKVARSQYFIYTSNRAGLRFQKQTGRFGSIKGKNTIRVNPNKEYQKILGFGGAFTDSTGINVKLLPEKAQEKLLESYFSNNGNEYSLCRVPMGGTDFSTHSYSYDDGKEDKDLKNVALADEDHEYKIPLMKKALQLTGGKLQFFGSTWTPPAWITTNGKPAGFLRKDMYQTWANYFLKFFEEYQKQGIKFWGVTTQNEPSILMLPTPINTVGWFSFDLSKWIANNLGPTLRNSIFSDLKIMVLDDQKVFLPWYVNSVLNDNVTRRYVDGIAIHWYLDMVAPPSVIDKTHDNFPDKFIISTEACSGFVSKEGEKVIIGSWERGENYADDIISDLNNWVTGWVDWNMVLDLTGGPTYINNNVDSPILVNASAGEFYKQPMFYALGHFSKFLPVDSVRIGVKSTLDEDVPLVGLKRPDGGIVVVILNRKKESVFVTIVDESRGTAILDISPESINTILFW